MRIKILLENWSTFDKNDEENKEKIKQQELYKKHLKETSLYNSRLFELKKQFDIFLKKENHQKRGFEFEKFLNELFYLYDLNPMKSYKIIGEQIDGAFTFDSTDYLLEAKWQEESIDAQDLYGFAGKIEGKLKNTLGLFIAINGFSDEATQTKSKATRSLVLMDGFDLTTVLEGRITLVDMLLRKRRYAAKTGELLYRCL